MSAQELKEKYSSLYNYMASSKNPAYMKAFGRVMTCMMDDMIANSTSKAEEYVEKLESIKWDNYLTPKEAETIVSKMMPKAPWSREQWKSAMEQHGFELEHEPHYNRCALWATMNMIMSDSSETLAKYVSGDKLFDAVYELAIDKLTDKDGVFRVRAYFGV